MYTKGVYIHKLCGIVKKEQPSKWENIQLT